MNLRSDPGRKIPARNDAESTADVVLRQLTLRAQVLHKENITAAGGGKVRIRKILFTEWAHRAA